MKKTSAAVLARIAIFTALYVVLTLFLMPISYGPLQFRLGEGLTILPLIFPECALALTLGCMLANLSSPYGILDVLLGGSATLIASFSTLLIGKYVKRDGLRLLLGGIPPIVVNAFIVPLVWIFSSADVMYMASVGTMLLTQAACVYGVGVPLFYALKRLNARTNTQLPLTESKE